MPGQLFSSYFLEDGILRTDAWKESLSKPSDCDAFRVQALALLENASSFHSMNEASTEQELIRPLLELLGWNYYLPQQGSARNEDIPDHLLFGDAESKSRASTKPSHDRYVDAIAVSESKRFGLALDARDHDDGSQTISPHAQILRYLATSDFNSDGQIRWGILTNGRIWRLYDRRARPRANGYFEVDLEVVARLEDSHAIRSFLLLFGRNAFTPLQGAQTSFLEDALAEGLRNENQVANDLSGVVFESVFPDLVCALAEKSEAELEEVRQASLIFLYRLLFLLYAEDRNLLPVNHAAYEDYGLRKSVRDDIAQRTKSGGVFSSSATNYFDHIANLCRQIDEGDPSIGLPPYNGGLFAAGAARLLQELRLSDFELAPIIYKLSHTKNEAGHHYVNYRDLSVQQLGSIYERLLEREPVRSADGQIVVRLNSYARKDSGSFYTPQPLVDLIVERTLGPLIEERKDAFEARATALKSDHRDISARLAELRRLDPAEAVLQLKVLDPAMGSGHFLVTAVDYLSDAIDDLVEFTPADAPWLKDKYTSPLLQRLEVIRRDIEARADAAHWKIDKAQLTDQAIIRRMVLKRCIYGVDKNPLTVELAKVSLWLHSFTVGAPLSFLDHHLRCGDSLIGLQIHDATKDLSRLGGFTSASAIQAAENATNSMRQIEEMSDADIAEVEESAALFHDVEKTTADLRGLLDALCGVKWLAASKNMGQRDEFEAPLVGAIVSQEDEAFALLANGPDSVDAADPIRQSTYWSAFTEIWRAAKEVADCEGFLHWEVAFPGVWQRWNDADPVGGFDVVIGNPPWAQVEQPEDDWFALRDKGISLAPTAAKRKALIKKRTRRGDELAIEYQDVRLNSAAMRSFVKASGAYPFQRGSRVNLYSLFVERAVSLVRPDGIVGLLVPSGIYADKTKSRFFQSVSTGGRVSGLLDFENRKIFFKDVHASFKFCAIVFGGEERCFDDTDCAFFLHNTASIGDPERCFHLAPIDFARVNPNTGTAPIFRTRRDADITLSIYEHHPVLVNRSSGEEVKAWAVRYMQGPFNMTSDSHLFRTAPQLDASGFYPVHGNCWKRGEELYLPLYQGRMIHQFDHRASSVRVNPESPHNPYLSSEVKETQHANPSFLPSTQYWVAATDVETTFRESRAWPVACRLIARTTDVRTVIGAIVPRYGFGHSFSVLVPVASTGAHETCLLVANLNCHCFDYVARQKLQGSNLSWYILEQLPVIAPSGYNRIFGHTSAGDLVRHHVLRLTYTAHDMEPYARDLGYEGPPFIWNDEDRRHFRARLDALFFHLYGLSREDAAYILDTFPIVRKHDEEVFDRYLTKEMILAYYNALASGDTDVKVVI